ncbi:cytochrome c [uncultured Spirosoma sp.]|uniref:c-type cytochrome n=1 Tax=uncultured Spirosoma sp. TaxID=278208 RepID=UPI0025908649|nr:cytochrome c [uncultured Spirosoma sp.]
MTNRTCWRAGFLLCVVGLMAGFRPTTGPPLTTSSAQTHSLDTIPAPARFGFGRPATTAELTRLDIDVRPDGKGLPAGAGTAERGKAIFATKCTTCHGVGGTGGLGGALVTTTMTTTGVAGKRPEKTIGNYWPYATTVFDYVRRAMPFNEPGSLTDEEVYHLTAYLLHANGIIDEKAVITAQTLPTVVMPAQTLFIPDDRRGGSEIR